MFQHQRYRALTPYVGMLAAAGLLAVAGCSGEAAAPEPAPTAPATSSASATNRPTPTASPSPAVPTLPAAAEGKGRKAAEAFARHYITLINTAIGETPSEEALAAVNRLDSLSSPTCSYCEVIVDSLRELSEREGSFTGGTWQEVGISTGRPNGGPLEVIVIVDIGEHSIRKSKNAETQLFTGSRRAQTFTLERGTGWIVASFDSQSIS